MTARAAAGTRLKADGLHLAVYAPDAAQLWLCLFDEDDRETRIALVRDGALHRGLVAGGGAGHALWPARRWRVCAGARAVVRSGQAAARSARD